MDICNSITGSVSGKDAQLTEWMQLISTLLGGVVGAVLAWFGATLKAKDSLRNDDLKWGRERVLFIESLYSEMIAAISQMINNAVNRTSNADVGYQERQNWLWI